MKNVIKFIAAVFMLGGVVSCEEDLLVYDTDTGFLQLSATTGSITEDTVDPIVTTVLVGSGTNENGVTVNFTVNSADASRFEITPASGSITIPAGEFSADISLQVLDNVTADGDLDVTIELNSSSSLPLGIGAEGNFSTSRTITIIDNDCPVDINAFVGTFAVFENFTGGVNSPSGLNNFFGESYQVELSLVAGDASGTKVMITNSPGFNEYIADGTVFTFLACSGEVLFDDGFPTVALFRTFEYDASSYSEADGVIQCTGPLATFGPYQFTFTKM